MKTVYEIRQMISHNNDGPVTCFVLTMRAFELCKTSTDVDFEDAANALYEELEARKMLFVDGGCVEISGS